MKSFPIISILLTAALLPLLASAGPGQGPGKRGPDGPGRGLEQADLNNDGVITADEFEEAGRQRRQEMFQRVDADGDGALTREELRRHHEHMKNERKERMQEHRELIQERRREHGEEYDRPGE